MKYRGLLSIFALLLLTVPATAQVQKIMTLAGNGAQGFSGDGMNASSAMLAGPQEEALDKAGNLYFVDFLNYRIRKVATNGVITTIAGNGGNGNTGNGSIGTSATIYPHGLAIDKKTNIYFTDENDAIIRKVNAVGIISLFAGGGHTGIANGYTGDGGKADTARFKDPQGICVDDTGNVYVADAGNHVIRKIDTFGFIHTVAGTGTPGYFGDGGGAIYARLDSPYAVVVDHKGNLYINDFNNNVIRMVDAATQTITTFAGTGAFSYSGDLGLAINATINGPRGLGVDTFNNLYFADAVNNVIRKVDNSGIISTVAGNGSWGFGGDLGFVTGANFKNPYAVVVDVTGNMYIADNDNERIRKTFATTGINNIVTGEGVDVYPNPSFNNVVVKGLIKSDVVAVTDIAGRQVTETLKVTTDGSLSVNVSALSAGVYMLQVWDNAGSKKATLKVVKE